MMQAEGWFLQKPRHRFLSELTGKRFFAFLQTLYLSVETLHGNPGACTRLGTIFEYSKGMPCGVTIQYLDVPKQSRRERSRQPVIHRHSKQPCFSTVSTVAGGGIWVLNLMDAQGHLCRTSTSEDARPSFQEQKSCIICTWLYVLRNKLSIMI